MSAAAKRRIDETLSALADPTRRRVVDLLRERPRRAGELAATFDVSAPAISRHLRVLRTRGLIEETRTPDDARALISPGVCPNRTRRAECSCSPVPWRAGCRQREEMKRPDPACRPA